MLNKIKKIYILIIISLITNVNANNNLTAISGNQSEEENKNYTKSTLEQIQNELSGYYQNDNIVHKEENLNDTTEWVKIGLPKNCTNWYKTVVDERRDCTIEEAQLIKDKKLESVLLSQMDVAFNTREVPYTETRELPPIIVTIDARPLGSSNPLYRNGESYEVIWFASGVDRCDVNIIPGNNNGFVGSHIITAENNTLNKINQELKITCYTPAEPVERFPINVAIKNIEIMPSLPIINITAPNNALTNRNFTVNWNTQFASRCNGIFETSVNNLAIPNGSRTYQYNDAGNKQITVICYNGENEEVRETRNIVVTWPAATVNFNVDKTTANINENIRGTWTSSDAINCNADFVSGNNNGTSGNHNFSYSEAGNKTVSVTCFNGGGVGTTVQRNININDPVPTVVLNAPSSVNLNQNFNVSWSSGPIISGVNYSTRCDADFISGNNNGLSGNRTISYNSPGSRNISVTCYNSSGQSATATRTIETNQIIPLVNLTSSSYNINLGDSIILNWNSTNAISCTNNFGGNGTNGSRSATPNSLGVITYRVTCTSSTGDSRSSSVNITVNAPALPLPTVSLTANPTNISSGNSTTLNWSSTNAEFCTNNFGGLGTSGSVSRSPTTITTYIVTCHNSTGSRTANVTVSIITEPLKTHGPGYPSGITAHYCDSVTQHQYLTPSNPLAGKTTGIITNNSVEIRNRRMYAPAGMVTVHGYGRQFANNRSPQITGQNIRVTVHLYGRLLFDSGVVNSGGTGSNTKLGEFYYPGFDARYGKDGDIVTVTTYRTSSASNMFNGTVSCPDRSRHP